MDRQCVKIDKNSNFINDANDWANETKIDHQYTLKLLQKIISVSLKTMKIVKAMPKLDNDLKLVKS